MSDSPTPATFSRHPMLLLACCFAIGVASCSFITYPIPVAVVLVVTAVIASRFCSPGFVSLLFISLGIICYQVDLNSVAHDRIRTMYSDGRIESGEPVDVEGVVSAFPETAFDGQFVTLSARAIRYRGNETDASGNVRLFSPAHPDLELKYGDRIRVVCRMLREEQYRNPGGRSRIASLDEQGIDATGIIKSPLLIEKLGSESVFIPRLWLHQWRQSLILAFKDNLSPPTAGVMIASLLGDKYFLDRETAYVFRAGGTFHVLVISGLHITFIGGLTFWLVSLFTRRHSWRCVLPALILWAYTLAVGAEIPVVRASLMFSILLLGRLIQRSGSLLNSLGTCGLVLLVWRPGDLFTASFQLTFVSVAALIACAFPLIEKLRAIGSWHPTTHTPFPPNVSPRLRQFCEWLYWNENAWRIENARQVWSANLFKAPYLVWTGPRFIIAYVFEGILVSLIVQLWMLPMLVIYFHRVTPSSLILNLWVGVFLAFESFAAVFAILLGTFSTWLSAPLLVIAEFSNAAMMWLPWMFLNSSIAGFRLPAYTGVWSGIYVVYAVIAFFAAVRLFGWTVYALVRRPPRSTNYLIAGLLCAAILVATFHPFSSPRPDGRLHVDFLDVGQGDSALVTFPTGQTMLIDGGGQMNFSNDDGRSFEPDRMRIGEAVVSEFLWEKGYSRVDLVLATHADADHMDGLIDVLQNFEVGELLIGDTRPSPVLDELIAVASTRNVELRIVGRGDKMLIGRAHVEFLNPGDDLSESDNDRSVVARIVFGNRSFLMTGDIERRAETSLDGELRSDVVKVAHHGSRTSSSEKFVETVNPEVAVISVGRRSRFGHPSREIVERWIGIGATVMTTGEKGTITISTDGASLDVETFVP